jgi:hypothetical protein
MLFDPCPPCPKCGQASVRYIVHLHGRNDTFVSMCPSCQVPAGDMQQVRPTWHAWHDHINDFLVQDESRTVAYYAREAARETAYWQRMREQEQRERERLREEREIRAALRAAFRNMFRDPPTVFGERRVWPPSAHIAGIAAVLPITQIAEIGGPDVY